VSPQLKAKVRAWGPAVFSVVAALAISVYRASHGSQVDIDVYLTGGKHVFSSGLYSARFQGLYFTYPPFAALVFALPALIFGFTTVQVLWGVVNIAALAALVYLTLRAVRPGLDPTQVWRSSLLLTLPALALNPIVENIGFGQVNLVLCVLILWDLLGRRRIGSVTVPLGVASGVAAAIKLTPLIFVPYLLLTRRIRGAVNATITFVVCELAALLASPSSSWAFWTKDIRDAKRAGALLYTSDQNLQSLLERFHHAQSWPDVVTPVVLVVGLLGLGVAAYAYRHSSPLLGLLVCAATALLVSPITWVHHMAWVLPVIIWLAIGADRPRFGSWIAGTVAVLFTIAPIWWVPRSFNPAVYPPELSEHGWQLIAANSFAIATILFIAGVGWMLASRARRAPHPADGGSGAEASSGASNGRVPESGGHLGELRDRAPVARRGTDREPLLEEGVVELRVPVATGTKDVDLGGPGSGDHELVITEGPPGLRGVSEIGKFGELRR
jgi:alpha-1,2-mannosyltransferase